MTTWSLATSGVAVETLGVGVGLGVAWEADDSEVSSSRGKYLSLMLPITALLVTTVDVVGVEVVETDVTAGGVVAVTGAVVPGTLLETGWAGS